MTGDIVGRLASVAASRVLRTQSPHRHPQLPLCAPHRVRRHHTKVTPNGGERLGCAMRMNNWPQHPALANSFSLMALKTRHRLSARRENQNQIRTETSALKQRATELLPVPLDN